MNRLIVISRRVQVGTSDLNEPLYEWQERHRAWAELVYKREDEAVAAGQVYAVRVVTFRTHYLDDVAETDRVECEGRTFEVKGVRELGFREGLEIAAEWQQ